MVILRPSLTSHSIPLYEIRKDDPRLARTDKWEPGDSESEIRNNKGTAIRHVVGEAKTKWIGTFQKCKVIGDVTSSV